ncbi:phage minor capsid protein [Arthrobacter russicus]|uniref:Phage minor capsid protein 2 n=2 Tax=Bacillati TaxID=1783272 RepID=A0ABU1J8Z8_9MICC|nr:phage minor capsid protein [Arthrobacter russicus]MDR6268910.1 hypothetical protein [Arthrobacter russicus]
MAQTQETQIQQQGLPATVDSLALAVVVVYQGAETELIVGSGRLIAQTIRSPDEAPYLLGRLQTLASSIRDRVRGAVLDLATQVVDEASRNGNLTAMREIRQLAGTGTTLGPGWLPHDVNSARLMAEDLARRLDAAALRMTRFADDAYRAATTSAALAQILDKATPAEAQAQAWRELSAKGVTGFTDKAGREWNLSSYVEMATRTATQKAFNASHKDRLTQAGIVYFTISTTGRPCPLCAPWEGRVLADAGKGVATEDGFTFEIAATVEEATATGLFHPNCKHTLSAFLPGSTVLRKNTWTKADEDQYKATQKLRAIERQIRTDRLVYASAVTDLEKARARRSLREHVALAKAYADQNNLLYRARRTSIDLGNRP